jgi:iron only hydrogenase large subunit-like protein/phenylpyruvate tautomerase PptA (4-oxalocrotonate tautomerase family)
MAELPLLSVIPDKCTLCYNCIRICPVKAIEVRVEQDSAYIIPNRCVGCGNCYTVCPHDAIEYRNDKELALALLAEPGIKVAMVDPSISGEFDDITDYRKFIRMLKALGYKELFENNRGKYYFTTTCPVTVSTIEKYHPDLVNNLAPMVSPMVATAQVVRKRYGQDIKVIYITPCIAAKDEAERTKDIVKVDAVLTFIEIRELFKEFEIKETALEFSKFNRPHGYKGTLYPLSEGLLQAGDIDQSLLSGKVYTAEGRKNFAESITQFETGIDVIQKHFNIYYCEGCLMGPGTSKKKERYKRQSELIEYARKVLPTVDYQEWTVAMEEYSDIALEACFVKNDQRITHFKREEVAKVLEMISNKETNPNHDCGACGYETCKEFAVAVSEGLAKTDMCISYSLRSRQDTIQKLRSANEELESTNRQLEQTKIALKESEELALQKQMVAQEASEITMAMLRKLPSAVVILDDDLKVLQSNEKFISILGDDAADINEIIPGLVGADFKHLVHPNIYNLASYVLKTGEEIQNRDIHHEGKLLNVTIFPIRQQKIVGAVFRDIYQNDVRPDEVIQRVTEVIEKNLKMVQNIGFLLGEGASETEQMLNSIIQSYKKPK